MAGGHAGVVRALEILTGEITRTMQLLGVADLSELSARHVTQLQELGPVNVLSIRR
jgi:L-lactate dehydrogenase (cytochrome)